MKPNIIGTVMVEYEKPHGAQFCTLHPNGNIALFYRILHEKHSDGKHYTLLQYHSSFGVWMGTNVQDVEKFLSEPKFFEIF